MTKFHSVFNRFLKGFASGAITAMSLVTVAQPKSLTDLAIFLNALGVAALFGGINGALLALQKWYSWVD